MKIFILEDDANVFILVDWLREKHTVIHAKNIEDAVYYLEYEEEIGQCDKFIFDAAVPAATVEHLNGVTKKYNKTLNGIDLLIDNIKAWNLDKDLNKIAILTAFDKKVKDEPKLKDYINNITLISKHGSDLVNDIINFLNK